jgi:tetratricopeptide (TPR) repeat protein
MIGVLSYLHLLRPVAAHANSLSQQADVRPLEFGKPIERELAGDETHTYQINVDSGQFLHVVVKQRGIDVVITIVGPDGQQLAQMDSPNGRQGPETISLVTPMAGDYWLLVRTFEKGPAPGHYEIRLAEVRVPLPLDKTRLAAERIFAEAMQHFAIGTAESLRAAVRRYEESLNIWRVLGDQYREALALSINGFILNSLGEPQQALDSCFQALPLSSWETPGGEPVAGARFLLPGIASLVLGDPWGRASTRNYIGMAYALLEDHRRALEHYSQVLVLRRKVGDRRGEAVTLNNMGLVYRGLEQWQEAQICFLFVFSVCSHRLAEPGGNSRWRQPVVGRSINR